MFYLSIKAMPMLSTTIRYSDENNDYGDDDDELCSRHGCHCLSLVTFRKHFRLRLHVRVVGGGQSSFSSLALYNIYIIPRFLMNVCKMCEYFYRCYCSPTYGAQALYSLNFHIIYSLNIHFNDLVRALLCHLLCYFFYHF